MRPIPIIIDTDIGDDVDDAFAITLAMQSPEVEILGVGTVFRVPEERAAIARALLAAGGRSDVPVAAGAKYPLVQREMFREPIDFGQKPFSFDSELEPFMNRSDEDAEALYERLLEAADRPVTIVTIGALTNVALLFRKRPDLKQKVERLVVMGGAYNMNFPEYNYSCDPEAANEVLASKLDVLAVGVDVTFQCQLGQTHVEQLAENNHPCIVLLRKLTKFWSTNIFLHDPLALMCVFRPEYVTFEKRQMLVETTGSFTRGMVVNLSDHNWKRPAEDSKIRYACAVDSHSFVDECVARLMRFHA